MKVEFIVAEKLSDRQEEALEQLGAAVYPPEVQEKLLYLGITAMVNFGMGAG